MKTLLYFSIMIWFIMTILIFVLNLTSKKTFSDREKNSPFECGFDPKNSARMPFSLQFFLIAVIFIIFDVELTLLLPMILALKISNMIQYTFIVTFFIFILLIGIYHEWNEGSLNWVV
uniref:NADH-ubiquinone oxidoreductase chain 3 n=1 Tax=Naupactus xanthographus TaxID=114905 RepID=D8WKQ6_NAUXA|nr:NADH dehydrogenase subunit 3 [Naupactus xanthographus]ACZ58589.1 NADH dehydrogenase subunit 3 [Naupactus xanthographus]